MAKLRMAHASMHGARKSPGPKLHIKGTREETAVTQRVISHYFAIFNKRLNRTMDSAVQKLDI